MKVIPPKQEHCPFHTALLFTSSIILAQFIGVP